MDTVFIEGLAIDTVIGVYDYERTATQRLLLDLDLTFDCAPAGATDALADALDYAAVASAVTKLVEASNCELVETLAEQVAAMVLHTFRVTQLRLRIRKPDALANANAVGVIIERSALA